MKISVLKYLLKIGALRVLGDLILITLDISLTYLRIILIHKYEEVTYFTKKLYVCDFDAIKPEYIITYKYLVQEATHEYHNLEN